MSSALKVGLAMMGGAMLGIAAVGVANAKGILPKTPEPLTPKFSIGQKVRHVSGGEVVTVSTVTSNPDGFKYDVAGASSQVFMVPESLLTAV